MLVLIFQPPPEKCVLFLCQVPFRLRPNISQFVLKFQPTYPLLLIQRLG